MFIRGLIEMEKVKGREQVFQLGVRYIQNKIDTEFGKLFVNQFWDETTKKEIREFFRLKYEDLKAAMPFLQLHEYPRVSIFVEDTGKLKIHVQGWYHNCEHCRLFGGMQYNKGTFYDFYVCMKKFNFNGGDNELFIRYGDESGEIYRRRSKEASYLGVKWRAIHKLYTMGFDEIVSINPSEFLKKEG